MDEIVQIDSQRGLEYHVASQLPGVLRISAALSQGSGNVRIANETRLSYDRAVRLLDLNRPPNAALIHVSAIDVPSKPQVVRTMPFPAGKYYIGETLPSVAVLGLV